MSGNSNFNSKSAPINNTKKSPTNNAIGTSNSKSSKRSSNVVTDVDDGFSPSTTRRRLPVIAAKPNINRNADPIMISMWLPKGGVGKTTTSFSMIFTLAERGYKVLAVDCDSQRDLSHLCLKSKYDESTDYHEDYMAYIGRPTSDTDANVPDRTLYQMLLKMDNSPWQIGDAIPETILESTPRGGSLHLLAGHRDLDMWDSEISANEATFVMFPANADRVGAPYHAVMKVARQINADIILLDLPPGKGSFTRAMLMSSDYFVVPTKPDYFSFEAVQSLIERLTKNDRRLTGQAVRNSSWVEYAQTYLVPMTAHSRYPFPNKVPKFLGFCIMDFAAIKLNSYETDRGVCIVNAAANVELWMNRIYHEIVRGAQQLVETKLVGNLQVPMAFNSEDYMSLNMFPFLLSKIHHFGQLQSLSHLHGCPVHRLAADQFVRNDGIGGFSTFNEMNIRKTQEKVGAFRMIFDQFAWGLLSLIHLDKPNGRILAPMNLEDGGHRPDPRPPFEVLGCAFKSESM